METPWIGIPEDYAKYHGFVYKITNKLNGKAYIGRKYFFFKHKGALIESDWASYLSSSKELKQDILEYGIDNFEFLVLFLGETKVDVNYTEVRLQIEADVLHKLLPNGEYAFYNKNIMSRYFQPKAPGTEEYKIKCKKISEAIKKLCSNPDYAHPLKGKIHPNKGKKLPQTGHDKNKGNMWYTDGTINLIVRSTDSVPPNFYRGVTHRKKRINTTFERKKYEYALNPNRCAICNASLEYTRKNYKTCSKRCKATLHQHLSKERESHIQLLKYKDKSAEANRINFEKGLSVKRWVIFYGHRIGLCKISDLLQIPRNTIVSWYLKDEDITKRYEEYCLKMNKNILKEVPEEWLKELR